MRISLIYIFSIGVSAIATSANFSPVQKSFLSKRSEGLSEEESQEIINEFRKNPNTDLMQVFKYQISRSWHNWLQHPQWIITKFPAELFKTVGRLGLEIMRDIAAVIEWLADAAEHPKAAGRDIKDYFHEIKTGLQSLREMWKESHRKALANFFGGFLIYVTHHGVEFSSQLILLLVAGGAIFHEISNAAEATFRSLGLINEVSASGFKNAVLGFLWFLHCIDDPLMIAPAVMNGVNNGLKLANNQTTVNSTTTTSVDFRNDVFGAGNLTFDDMTVSQRSAAFLNFQRFICNHTTNGTVQVPETQVFPAQYLNASLTNRTVTNGKVFIHYDCQKLSATH